MLDKPVFAMTETRRSMADLRVLRELPWTRARCIRIALWASALKPCQPTRWALRSYSWLLPKFPWKTHCNRQMRLIIPCITRRCLQQMGLQTTPEQAVQPADLIRSVVKQIRLQELVCASPRKCKVGDTSGDSILQNSVSSASSARQRYKKQIAR